MATAEEWPLAAGYRCVSMTAADFFPVVAPLRAQVFAGDLEILPEYYIKAQSNSARPKVKSRPIDSDRRVMLAVVNQSGYVVAWSWGKLLDDQGFYMINSAVLPSHRGVGLYKSLLRIMTEKCRAMGAHYMYSRHSASDNHVIVPKLKDGFIIYALEMSDVFGLMVCLKKFLNSERDKVMRYRIGNKFPDKAVRDIIRKVQRKKVEM